MVTVIARWKVKEHQIENVLDFAKLLVDASRLEDGNVKYDLYSKTESLNEFLVFEIYKTMADFEFHKATSHFNEIAIKKISPLLEEKDLSIFED